MTPNILSIAGSDPSGGAGIQADLKTFAAHGCYGMAAITALTAQNTQKVLGVETVSPAMVTEQLTAIFEDIRVDAVKIGMLGNPETVEAIAKILQKYKPAHIVLDPVMVATSGDRLVSDETISALKKHLIPLATIITPNKPEYTVLGDISEIPTLVKGGHDDGKNSIDVLYINGTIKQFSAPRIDTKNTHGTGCTLSSAIACNLAKGLDIEAAINAAKHYVTQAILNADELDVGRGHGPLNHGWRA